MFPCKVWAVVSRKRSTRPVPADGVGGNFVLPAERKVEVNECRLSRRSENKQHRRQYQTEK